MSHRVPDFKLDDVYSLPTSSGLIRKSSMAEDEVMELLWQNGPVVAHSQNQRSGRRTSDHAAAAPPTSASETPSTVEAAAAQQDHLFMQEDEMASWLHYPLHETTFERDISEYFNPPPPPSTSVNATISVALPQLEELKLSTSIELQAPPQRETVSLPALVATRPPVAPSVKQKEVIVEPPPPRKRVQNFAHFAKLPSTAASRLLSSVPGRAMTESAVVGSNDTPKVSQVGSSRIPEVEEGGGTSTRARDFSTTANTYDFTLTSSSPTDSSASLSASIEPAAVSQERRKEAAMGEDRKRKGRETDDNEGTSLEHDTEFEFEGEKKKTRGSTSSKRSRAAEVHNLSERRRRDRINERMKTLQELIPRCNKTDKASMLDEAIEYLKTLQLQVQMMSMGCGMVPIVYPGVQQYMPAMGMGMGMGMDLSMNRPLLPYPPMLQGSSMPNPVTGAPMAPRFPIQAFPMPVVHDPSRMQAQNTVDPMMNPMAAQSPHPNFINPYQQYLGPQPGQVLIPQQNQTAVEQNNSKPSTSREDGNPETHQPGG